MNAAMLTPASIHRCQVATMNDAPSATAAPTVSQDGAGTRWT